MAAPRLASVVLMLLTLSACEGLTDADGLDPDRADYVMVEQSGGLVFITQNAPEVTGMDALFNGVINADDDGCLRLEGEGEEVATAVWPFGFTLSADGSVLDEGGQVLGTVGEAWELPGGFVATLPDSMGFTDADRELAADRCPGSYWIVAPAG